VARTVEGRGNTGGNVGADVKSGHRPYGRDWKHGPAHAQAAPRCRARCRRSKLPCRAPAMRGQDSLSPARRKGRRSEG
jgi:hypothetical protein